MAPDPGQQVRSQKPSGDGVERVFGNCSTHGSYELPVGSIESGEIPRDCPGCVHDREQDAY